MASSARLLFRSLAPYRSRLAVLALLIVASTAFEGLGVGLFYPLVAYIQNGAAFLSQGPGLKVARTLSWAGLSPSVGLFVGLIFCVIAVATFLKWAVLVASERIYNPMMKSVRDLAFANILESHLSFFQGGSSAALVHALDDEVEHLGQSFNFLALLVTSAVAVLVYVGLLVWASWRLTLLVFAIAVARYAVSSFIIRRTRTLGQEHGVLKVRLKGLIAAIYQGIEVVKAFAAEAWERRRFEGVTADVERNASALAQAQAGNSLAEGLLGDGLLCLVVYLAVSGLSMGAAKLLTFLFVITRVIPKVAAINDARIRLAEYLSRLHFLPDALGEGKLPRLSWGAREKSSFDKEIVFEDVSFKYARAEHASLINVSLTLKRGETVALVGETGAGKSTLARLLLRLFDPTEGRVLVDGVPLPELRREDWARLVSVVSQEPFLFDDTLEANVRYGSPDAPPEKVQDAMRRARASEFVERLPQREKTRLGERGGNLSGGQRQRVAIARAFLRDSPILILDEATSAMDAVTERLIQDAIEELARERTMLVIAHRFTTIRGADRIVVLAQGRVAEQGTHDELLAHGPLYKRYHDLQAR